MKKVLLLLFIMLMLTGCSTKNIQKSLNANTVGTVGASNKQEQGITTLKLVNHQTSLEPVNQQLKVTQQAPSDKDKLTVDNSWFAGSLGNAKIHAKFDISNFEVSGIYYYDKYKKEIKLEGFIDEPQMKDYKSIFLTEDTENKGEIHGFYKTKDFFEGCWKKGNIIYPIYLIREGSNISIPKQPGINTMKFNGHWTGKNSSYFGGSEVDIKVLFDDLIFYDLNAFSGANIGDLTGFGIVNNNISKSVFKDKTYDEKKENVVFKFHTKTNRLYLDSNMYEFGCGMGVDFDSSYVKGKVKILKPNALQVGIVDTKEQDTLFKKIVGTKYDKFINYTSYVDYSVVILDGEKVKAGDSLLRGCSGYCSYIISPTHIYAAIVGDNCIDYYTNDKRYSKSLPKPIAKWKKNCWAIDNGNTKIIYHYKE